MIALATTPFVLCVVTPIGLISGSLVIAHRAKGVPAKLGPVAVIFAVVFSCLSALAGLLVYSSNQRDYRDCVYGVNRSFGSRHFNEKVIAVIARELPNRPDIADELRTELDLDLPMRSLSECDGLNT